METRLSHSALVLLVSSALFLTGCATAPTPNMVERPWSRIDSSPDGVPLGTTVWVTASGECEPLLGDRAFMDRRIADTVLRSLTRRGYVADSLSSQVVFRVKYRTARIDYTTTSTGFYSTTNQVTLAASGGSARRTGPGVGLATAIAGISSAVTTKTSFSQQSLPAHHYAHAIAITAETRGGERLWQADSNWEAQGIDLLENLGFAVQTVVSNLPSDTQRVVAVPEIDKARVGDYYSLNCARTWFTCPGLPYRIVFYDRSDAKNGRAKSSHWEALPAFLDLIRHAEYALPVDVEYEKASLLSPDTWKTMLLGGRYQLGQRPSPTNVVVRLVARPSGYLITSCSLLTDAEYVDFQKSMDRWREVVRKF
jgi:hypothetical protein